MRSSQKRGLPPPLLSHWLQDSATPFDRSSPSACCIGCTDLTMTGCGGLIAGKANLHSQTDFLNLRYRNAQSA
jgi:hypothetical protein